MDRKEFGALLREKRIAIGMSGAELARRLGVAPEQVSRYESGKTIPTVGRIEEIASIIGIDLKELEKPTEPNSTGRRYESDIPKIFSDRIKKTRFEKGFSQIDVSKKADRDNSWYANYEHGKRALTISNAALIADALEVSLDYLTGRTDNPEINK